MFVNPSRLSATKSPGNRCRDSLGSCIFQGLPKTPRRVPKIFKTLNYSGDSNGGFLESPDNTHQLPGESLGSPRGVPESLLTPLRSPRIPLNSPRDSRQGFPGDSSRESRLGKLLCSAETRVCYARSVFEGTNQDLPNMIKLTKKNVGLINFKLMIVSLRDEIVIRALLRMLFYTTLKFDTLKSRQGFSLLSIFSRS
jgi:hypothetical protein